LASDTDGSVVQVQFFNGSTSLGMLTAKPYGIILTNLAAGSYTLSAVATDNLNATATNSVTITVTNPPPLPVVILNPSLKDGTFSFSFKTQTGHVYSAQHTAVLNPSNWLTFTNFLGDGSGLYVTDSNLTNSRGFYRIIAQ
jgi:hypothetical protein